VCLLAAVLVCSLVRRRRLVLFVLLLVVQFVCVQGMDYHLTTDGVSVNVWSLLPLLPAEMSWVKMWFLPTLWDAEVLASLRLLLGVKLAWLVALLVIFARFPRK
jgi:hypothetical protein